MKMMTNCLQGTCQYLSSVEQSEITFVHSAQSGDLEAFNLIVLQYQDVMFRTALRILGQDDLAGDATQEAFISAYQHISHFRGGSLKAWLLKIVVNKCYDVVRRDYRNNIINLSDSLTGDSDDMDFLSTLQDGAPSVEDCVETTEWNDSFQGCLSRLPVNYRSIIALVDIEELPYDEAATVLKIPVGTVKSRLARARFKLRKEMAATGTFGQKAASESYSY